MRHPMFRRTLTALTALLIVSMLAGCSGAKEVEPAASDIGAEKPAAIKIGTLSTEDSLPLWVAEDKGYFKEAGLDSFEMVVFQSAQERDAAYSAGSIDGFMGDMIAAANLEAAGSGCTILTVMLGADQSQGRFGVVLSPKSTMDLKEGAGVAALKGVPVGTSSATIQEYVLDGLMAEAAVAMADVKVEEVKKVPVRFELLMNGKLQAAALPEPFLSLAQQGGAQLLGDDTESALNLSQTVLVVSDDYLRKPGGNAAAAALQVAWDKAVDDINISREAFRPMLVEKARLPKPLESTYVVNEYPKNQLPEQAEVDAVLDWMRTKGYLKAEVTYEDLTLVLPEK